MSGIISFFNKNTPIFKINVLEIFAIFKTTPFRSKYFFEFLYYKTYVMLANKHRQP